jgi:hypothetical protein
VELVGRVEGSEGRFGVAESGGQAEFVDRGVEVEGLLLFVVGLGEGLGGSGFLLHGKVVLPALGHDDFLPCFFLVLVFDVLDGLVLILDLLLHGI